MDKIIITTFYDPGDGSGLVIYGNAEVVDFGRRDAQGGFTVTDDEGDEVSLNDYISAALNEYEVEL